MRVIPSLVLILTLSVSAPINATTYVVRPDGTGDFPTIQGAVDVAVDGDEIELTSGTFRGEGNRDILVREKSLILRSASGDPNTCRIDAEELSGALTFVSRAGDGSVVRGVTIENCQGERALSVTDHAWVDVRNCRFESNRSGAVSCAFTHDGLSRFTEVLFLSNTSSAGAAIHAEVAQIDIVDCEFRSNRVSGSGGAVYATSGRLVGPLMISGSVFWNNTAGFRGGALRATFTAVVVSGSTFVANSCSGEGGQIQLGTGARLHMSACIVAFAGSGCAIRCPAEPVAFPIHCSNIFGNAGGDWQYVRSRPGTNGNLSLDPRFCDLASGDVRLDAESPCLPDQHPQGFDCDLIGAMDRGCGQEPVREVTWGRLKATDNGADLP